MKVLFCTDGSKISYGAIKNFSKWFTNIEVDIFCAIDWSYLPDTIAVEDSDFALKCTNSADTILDYSQNLLEECGIKIGQKIKICGTTVDSINEVCKNNSYDFIVLGSNGKKGIQKWLGSVSQEIASSSKISTYISKYENSAKKVLFALDSSDVSKAMIEYSLKSINFYDKYIILATVYESPDYLFLEGNIDSNWISEVDKKQGIAAKLLLNEYESLFNKNNIEINDKIILHGNPANEIIRHSLLEQVELVVCGVRERKYLAKFIQNSVSKRILENTNSDVLIVRPNNHQE